MKAIVRRRSQLRHTAWSRIAAVGWLFALECLPAASGNAQSNWGLVQPSVVRIRVTGLDQNTGRAVENWGSGFFISTDGLILTAFHVVGRSESGEIIEWGEGKQPTIAIEEYGIHGVLETRAVSVVISKKDADLDVALLKASGESYHAVRCRVERVADNSNVWGIGWQRGRDGYDPLGPGIVGPSDAHDGDRYRLASMGANKGNSGGPIFDDGGRVVGVITSGRNQVLAPGQKETFATPLTSAWTMLLPSSSCWLSQQDRAATAADPLIVEGIVKDRNGSPLDANVYGRWDGLERIRLTTSKLNGGRIRIALDPPGFRKAKTVMLTFAHEGFQPESIPIRMSGNGNLIPLTFDITLREPDELGAQVNNDDRSRDGRTLFFFPYAMLSQELTNVGQQLNGTMPFHVKYGIVTRLSGIYNKVISVENLQALRNLGPVLDGISAFDSERLRQIGFRLNALGVITGFAGPPANGTGASEPEIDIVSTYLLPTDVAEDVLPGEMFVTESVRPSELTKPAFGEKLNRAWALRTILALAEKEYRTGADTSPHILAYLQKASQIAVDDKERQGIALLLERVKGQNQ